MHSAYCEPALIALWVEVSIFIPLLLNHALGQAVCASQHACLALLISFLIAPASLRLSCSPEDMFANLVDLSNPFQGVNDVINLPFVSTNGLIFPLVCLRLEKNCRTAVKLKEMKSMNLLMVYN